MILRQLNLKWFHVRLNLRKNVLKVITSTHVNVYLNTMMFYVNNVKLFMVNVIVSSIVMKVVV
ncbi:Uncharacterised protein [Mycobacteroides abscessus]|nr:Uncharacterised protein [Mycobacteroides abscessus]